MEDRGRDIAPDEERFNYSPDLTAHSNDLGEDAAPRDLHPQMIDNASALGIRSRNRQIIQEPEDATADATQVVYENIFPPQPHQISAFPGSFVREEARLQTFSDWRFQNVVRKEDLARNGFTYTGTGDKVRCVFCNGILREWEVGDVVEDEHRRNYPSCPFLCGDDVGNVPLEQTAHDHQRNDTVADARSGQQLLQVPSNSSSMPSPGYDISPAEEGYAVQPTDLASNHSVHETVAGKTNVTGGAAPHVGSYSNSPRNPQMSTEPSRLATFKTWPVQLKQKPSDLAKAGLYYIGDGDRVKCFHCGGLLYGWEPTDDPFQEHARWFPSCQYIRLVKGEGFVSDVQNGRVTEESVMQTPAVLAVLYEGHNVDTVQKALYVMRQTKGANVVVTARDLLTTVLELEVEQTPADHTTNGHLQPEEIEKLQLENETLRDKQLCKICMEKDVEVIFYPCKHFVCCVSCGAAVSVCPICRVTIDSVDKVFMA